LFQGNKAEAGLSAQPLRFLVLIKYRIKLLRPFLPKIMKRLKKLKLVYLPQLVQKILPYLRVMKNKQSTMIEIKFTSKNEL